MPSLKISNVDGDTLVAAPSAYQFIRVIGLDLTASGDADNVSLKSDTTVIWDTYAMNRSDGGGIALNIDPNRTIDCAPGKALKLAVGAGGGVTIKGSIEYVIKGRPDTALAPLP